MKKDMFYYSGFPDGGDGRCSQCQYTKYENINEGLKCSETGQDVNGYCANDRINYNCPFITK